jgi:hypothetical protein
MESNKDDVDDDPDEELDGPMHHTSIEWKLRESHCYKSDENMKSFLFGFKNFHNVPAQKSARKTEEKRKTIQCVPDVNALKTPGWGCRILTG